MSSVPLPPLPQGTQPLSNQVAGHKYGQGKTKLGCLQHADGTILKPVQSPPRGERERDFYSAVFSQDCKDSVLLELRDFVPKFHHVVQFECNPEVCYLKLDNMLSRIRKPCIVDIKMGKITYDPDATPEKIAVEVAKFPPVEKLGYQLSGMEVYYSRKGQSVKYDKYYCKKLFEDTMITDGLGKFFQIDEGLRKDMIKAALKKLKRIEQWFEHQRIFAFYASSILIVYEGENYSGCEKTSLVIDNCSGDSVLQSRSTDRITTLSSVTELHANRNSDSAEKEETHEQINSKQYDDDTCRSQDKYFFNLEESPSNGFKEDNIQEKDNCEPRIEICMIDFTHVFHSTEKDENYLFGLKNLIKHLEILLDT